MSHPLPLPEGALPSAAGVQVAARWWAQHLQGAVPIILLTDPDCRLNTLLEELCVGEDTWGAMSGLRVLSGRHYFQTLWSHDTEVCHLAQALVSDYCLPPPACRLL